MAIPNQLTPEVELVLAHAVGEELYASHLYKHIANQLQRLGYFGAQKYFLKESADELAHYQLHVDYVNDRGGVVKLPGIKAITTPIGSLTSAIQAAYDTEYALQQKYVEWYGVVDVLTKEHLLQFLNIQRKSVGEMGDLLARLERAGGNPAAILMIDQELGG